MCREQKVCIQQSAAVSPARRAAGGGRASLLLPRRRDVAPDHASFHRLELSLSKGEAQFKCKWDIPDSFFMDTCFIILKSLKGWIYFLFFRRHTPNLKGVRDKTPVNPTLLANGKLSALYSQRVLPSWVLVLPNLGVRVSLPAPASPPRSAEPLARHHPAHLAAGVGSPLPWGQPHPGPAASPTTVSEFMGIVSLIC